MRLDNGEQKILVWCSDHPGREIAIKHGFRVASILKKELCLLSASDRGNPDDHRLTRLRLEAEALRDDNTADTPVHVTALTTSLKDQLTHLAEEADVLLLIAHKEESDHLLRVLPHSGFPFLFVNCGIFPDEHYRNIFVPVGYLRKSKDLALWSSYFGRHRGSEVSLLMAGEKDEKDRKKVNQNIHSIQRLFNNFSFPHRVIPLEVATWRLQRAGLEEAKKMSRSLLVISFTYGTTLLDRLLGLTDQNLIKNSETVSLLCINSQRDLYTLCG